MLIYSYFVISHMVEHDLANLLIVISEDLHWIRKDIARLARDSYRKDLDRVANTPVRQEIWRLCGGDLSTDEIAKKIGISSRAVQYFVQDADKLGLIITPKRGYPKRPDSFDVIPTEWKPFKKSDVQTSEESDGSNE